MPTLIFTLLPSRDFPIQALLFPNSTSISFFIPPINTVFYLIEQLINTVFVLLNDCDKEQIVIKNRKRRACVEANNYSDAILYTGKARHKSKTEERLAGASSRIKPQFTQASNQGTTQTVQNQTLE